MHRDLLATTPACRSRRGMPAAGPELFEKLETIALGSQDRLTRAQRAVELIRMEEQYLVVSLTELRGGLLEALAVSTEVQHEGSARRLSTGVQREGSARGGRAEVQGGGELAVVPVLSLTGMVLGTLDVEADPDRPLTEADRLRLDACAGVLWWLWSDCDERRPSRE